mgnify:CR=1 FL=1
MIEIENEEIFGKVIAASLKRVDDNRQINTIEKLRWVNAIAKATTQIERRGCFMDWNSENETLLIWSESNEIYEPGNSCTCLSAMNGNPCWHVAAKRLYELYALELDQVELQTRNARNEALANMPYLKNSARPAEVIGGVRI